ncbi:MAG: PilT/PilU family type 4a pilus ATPase [Candidatus Paceibacterota bacterium]
MPETSQNNTSQPQSASGDYAQRLDSLIQSTSQEGASDLHFSVGRRPTVRIAGKLVPLGKEQPLSAEDIENILKEMISAERYEEFHAKQEIDFSYTHEATRFRCNAFVQQGVVGIAMRFIPHEIRSFEELNLPSVLGDFALQEQGFFLVVGPVGHGKTTTLASMIQYINMTNSVHIVTIEDPIEYLYEQQQSVIDQREVGTDTEDFSTALKSIFRQDVDVVLVGEMRGPETISTAVTAAETGHLVLSTLHTNDAPQTIDRIIDSFPANQQQQIRAQLASSLSGIFSQRLVPAVSGGVIPAYELLVNNNAVRNLIREERVHEIKSVIETGQDRGMVDMNRSLVDHVRSGEITMENAKRFSLQPDLLDKLL